MAEEEFETNENDEEELYQSNPPIDNYIYSQDNNSGQVQGNNSRKESLKQAKQIQNNLGSQALQRMGVPKQLSNYVSKHGDGFFSPNNNLANKMLKKQGQNLIANHIENRKKIENGEEEQKSVVDQVANKAVEKGGSMALQAAGVPKPIADAVSQKLAGPATELLKKKLKIQITIACIAIFLIIIILVPLFAAGGEANNTYDSDNDEMTDYLYGNGSEENLYKYLVSLGYCENVSECPNTDAAKFYKKIKEVLNNNNLKKHEADVLIIRMIMYGRDETQAFKATDEIEYLAKILGDASFSIDNPDSIKDKIIGQGGYFDTYRSDLFDANKDNSDIKLQIFNSIIGDSKILKEEIDNSIGSIDTYVTGGTCSYNVEGKIVSNIKVKLLQCGDGKRGQPIDGEELVDFEKYILGVTYAENNTTENGAKVEAIAARSYALLRHKAMNNASNITLKQENGYWILSIRNCTEDQVYCDPDKGCWSNDKYANKTVHSGRNSSAPYNKPPLSQDAPLRKWVSETSGMIAVNYDGTIYYTNYVDKDQQVWNEYAKAGDDPATIIKKHYSGASVTSTCTSNNLATGDFTNWKQGDSRWSSINLGSSNTTIGKAGCLVTSVAIQLAKSGVQTSINDLNPGTFVQALNQNGGFSGANYNWSSVTKIAPNFVLGSSSQNLYGTKAQKASQLKKELDSGNYVVIRAKTNQHWVALDRVEGENVYIHDPAGPITSLWDSYSENDVTRYAYYKIQ